MYSLNVQGLPVRVYSSLLDLTPGAQDPEFPPHRPQIHVIALARLSPTFLILLVAHYQYQHPVTQDAREGGVRVEPGEMALDVHCSLITSHTCLTE